MPKYKVGYKAVKIDLDDKYSKLKIELIDNVPNITGPNTYENRRAVHYYMGIVYAVDRRQRDKSVPLLKSDIEEYKRIKEYSLPFEGGELGKYLANLIEIKRKWF